MDGAKQQAWQVPEQGVPGSGPSCWEESWPASMAAWSWAAMPASGAACDGTLTKASGACGALWQPVWASAAHPCTGRVKISSQRSKILCMADECGDSV